MVPSVHFDAIGRQWLHVTVERTAAASSDCARRQRGVEVRGGATIVLPPLHSLEMKYVAANQPALHRST